MARRWRKGIRRQFVFFFELRISILILNSFPIIFSIILPMFVIGFSSKFGCTHKCRTFLSGRSLPENRRRTKRSGEVEDKEKAIVFHLNTEQPPTKYARDGTSLAVGESSTEANNNKKLCCYVFHFLNQLFYFVTLGGLRWKFFIDTDIDDLPHLVILVCHISNPTLRGCRPVHTPESSY
jgi:hypothetical protein